MLWYWDLVSIKCLPQSQDRKNTTTRDKMDPKSRIVEISYQERLQTLDMMPLCYDREIQDLVFFYKALYGYVDLDMGNYVSFVSHDRSRLTLNPSLLLQVPLCRTTTFKNSYFNWTVHLWNVVCRTASPNSFVTLFTFKNFLLTVVQHKLN
jgi:hypothetical protein